MAVVNGCELPEGLYFDVERSIWARVDPDGLVTAGFSDPFQTRAGRLLHIQPLPERPRQRGRACATVESAKWVGGFAMVLSGTVVEFNPDLLADPQLANRDPYGAGWVARIRPAALDDELAELLTGAAAVAAYRTKLESEQVRCYRCVE